MTWKMTSPTFTQFQSSSEYGGQFTTIVGLKLRTVIDVVLTLSFKSCTDVSLIIWPQDISENMPCKSGVLDFVVKVGTFYSSIVFKILVKFKVGLVGLLYVSLEHTIVVAQTHTLIFIH